MKNFSDLLWLLIAIAVLMIIFSSESKGLTILDVGMSVPTEKSGKVTFEGDVKWLSPKEGYWYYGMHLCGNTEPENWAFGFGPMFLRRGLDYVTLLVYLGEGGSADSLAYYDAAVGVVGDLTPGPFRITGNVRYLWCMTEQNDVIERKAVVNPLRVCLELGEFDLGGSLVALTFMGPEDYWEISAGLLVGWRNYQLVYYIGETSEVQLRACFKF